MHSPRPVAEVSSREVRCHPYGTDVGIGVIGCKSWRREEVDLGVEFPLRRDREGTDGCWVCTRAQRGLLWEGLVLKGSAEPKR